MLICTDYNKMYAEVIDTDDFVIEKVTESELLKACEMGLTIRGAKPCGSIIIPSPARDLIGLLESLGNVIERQNFILAVKSSAGKQYPIIYLWYNGYYFEIEASGTERNSYVHVNKEMITRSIVYLFNTLGIFGLRKDGTFYLELLGGNKYDGDVYKLVFDGKGRLKTQNCALVNLELGKKIERAKFKQYLLRGGM